MTEIGIGAFRFCHGLTSITIPKSVTVIGDLAFDETNISSIYFEGNAPLEQAFYHTNLFIKCIISPVPPDGIMRFGLIFPKKHGKQIRLSKLIHY